MLRFGIIDKVDAEACRVRVQFADDNIVSDWLPVLVQGSSDNKYFHIFTQGEHVVCMLDEHAENGVVLGAIYSAEDKPGAVKGKGVAGVQFADGTKIKYDQEARKLTINTTGDVSISCGNAEVLALQKVSITAPQVEAAGAVTVTGALTVSGALSVAGAIAASGGMKGAPGQPLAIDGEVTATDFKAGLISLKTHKHTATGATSPTTTPIP